MKKTVSFEVVAVSLLLVLGLSACDKPGPAESAGKKIDKAAEKMSKNLVDATEKVEISLAENSNKAGGVIDDAQITTKVKAAIFAEPGLKSLQIGVDTVNAVVSLSGSVDSQANSNRAQGLAGAVSGVNQVKNHLVIKPLK
ncbi:MAG: BON domain-containing protein [Sideroxydans sp.]|nr:BON domain-containing protein [Sideroxydans sp.]